MSRDEKVVLMMAWDIVAIKDEFSKNEYGYITTILEGINAGWTSYCELSDEEIDVLFNEAKEEGRLDDEVEEIAKKLRVVVK